MVVVLLALLLGGCGIRIETGGGTPPAPGTASRAPTSSDGSAVSVADTRVERAPAPDTRADDERTAVQISDAFWRSWFRDQGRRYVSPRVAGGYTGTGGPRCAGEPSVPGNAYYCPSGNFLAWDENLMRAGYTQIGDAWVYLVIAHEWGHAIQAQLPRRLVARQIELQADCLAGAALQGASDQGLVRIEEGDDEEIQRTLAAVADDYPWTDESSHGNAQQRISAFRTGLSGVDACLG